MFGGNKPADFEVGTSLAFQLFAPGDSKQLGALVKRAKVRHCRVVLKVGRPNGSSYLLIADLKEFELLSFSKPRALCIFLSVFGKDKYTL